MAFPLPTNITGACDGLLYCLAQYTNTVSEGRAFTLFLLGFVIVLFMATQRFGTARSFGFASVGGLFGAIFLSTLQLMEFWIASIFIIAGIIGFAGMIINNR